MLMLILILKIIVIIVIIIDVKQYVNFMLYRMEFYNREIEEMILYRSLYFCSFVIGIGEYMRNLNFVYTGIF
jgi:hypothetical protein